MSSIIHTSSIHEFWSSIFFLSCSMHLVEDDNFTTNSNIFSFPGRPWNPFHYRVVYLSAFKRTIDILVCGLTFRIISVMCC